MIASYLGISFFYIAFALIVYALMDTASKADDIMEQEFKKNCNYWRTQYNCKGGENNGN